MQQQIKPLRRKHLNQCATVNQGAAGLVTFSFAFCFCAVDNGLAIDPLALATATSETKCGVQPTNELDLSALGEKVDRLKGDKLKATKVHMQTTRKR